MKNTLVILFAIFTQVLSQASAFAQGLPQTLNYYESATEFGFCSGIDFTFCSQDIENRAKSQATTQGANECYARGGKPDSYSNCNSNCYPFFLPTNAPFQSVNCTSNCEVSCQVTE